MWVSLTHLPPTTPGGPRIFITPVLKSLPHLQIKSWLSKLTWFTIADSTRDHFPQKEVSLDCLSLIPAPTKYT